MKQFPVLNPPDGCAKTIPWDCVNEKNAYQVHGQTVERLAERGGLSPHEIFFNHYSLRFNEFKVTIDEAVALVNKLNKKAR